MKRLSIAALALAAVAAGCKPQQQSTPSTPGATEGAATASVAAPPKSPNAVKLEFFVMSQCPYGVQVMDGVKESVDKLGGELDLTIDYIGNVAANGELTSMHGPNEVAGDIVQLCAAKHAPGKYMDMVVCQNKDFQNVATNWERCAQDAKLPVEKIRACYTGAEGKELLTASFKKAQQRGASGSPTMFLNGRPYNGKRGSADFLRAICGAHTGPTKPAACQSLPELPKANVTILGDKRCTECRDWTGMLQSRMAAPVIKTLDYADEEGKKLYQEMGGGNLPMVLFDSTLDADKDAMAAFARFLKPAGSMRTLDIGSSWNPACADEGGCDKPECKDNMICRKEIPNKLDVFVMSQCPYGVKALNAMEEVLKNFDKKIDFNVHFIANGTAKDGFQALHGQPEVDENIRELCAIKHYGKDFKYMDYVLCRNKNIRSTEWESCATNGIDVAVMKKCFEGEEGKKLHEEDIKVANSLGIGASPTWLANNKYKFSGIDAETIRRNLCQHNAGLKGCENTLSGNTGAPVQGGCGK